MSFLQHLAILVLAVISTQLTRFLPFLLFPAGKPTPARVRYLARCCLRRCSACW